MLDQESDFSFVWKIENFSMLPHQLGEKLVSPKFVVDACEKVGFCLWLYPRGDTADYLSLYLCKETDDQELKLNFTLELESSKPSETILLPVKDRTLKTALGFESFVSLKDIYDEEKHYLPQDTLTIRCTINPAEESSTNQDSKSASMFLRKNCVSRTCIQVQRRSIMWSIRKVKNHIERLQNTSIFLTSALKDSPSLKLSLNFNKNRSCEDIPIMIKQTNISSESKQVFVKCKITVASVHEDYQISKTSSHLFKLSVCDEWSFPSFLTTSMLTDEKCLNVDDTLFLRCEFAFSYKDDVIHLENNNVPCVFKRRDKNGELTTCFEQLYDSGKFCDVELKAGGKTFPYFKLVLCARSSVFRAMFENDMKEKNSNSIDIEDVDPDTLQMMLNYMHSDVLQEDLSSEEACSLYRVADKYDLASLKNICSVLLATTVSVLNVCDLLDLADTHGDNFLMTAVSDFICSHTTEVFHSVEWENFMEDDSKLACKVMHKMLAGKCQF